MMQPDLADLIHIRALLCSKLKAFVLCQYEVISIPVVFVESEFLHPVSNSNFLVFKVLDIFTHRVMNKVAWIVQVITT